MRLRKRRQYELVSRHSIQISSKNSGELYIHAYYVNQYIVGLPATKSVLHEFLLGMRLTRHLTELKAKLAVKRQMVVLGASTNI